jgi:enoyl-CoA hydratase/carnithine racemase
VSQPELIVEQRGRARVLTLNRPESLNALSGTLQQALSRELQAADDDPEARVVIITGAGRAFCAGGDVKAMYGTRVLGQALPGQAGGSRQSPHIRSYLRQGHIPIMIRRISKPVIAAVNGDAAGAGCDIALACDIRIASERARFGEVFARMGLVPDNGGMYLLPRLVGLGVASEMILTAEMMPAVTAGQIGLVNKVVPHEELMAATLDLAGRIALNPPLALAMAKLGLQKAQHLDFEESFDWVNYAMNILRASQEHKDAVRRFVEERDARRARPE